MRNGNLAAATLAAVVALPALAQSGGDGAGGGAQAGATSAGAPQPAAMGMPPEETPEQIAKDAARDLTPTRFYNRPGATRAEFNAAWQDCRLIARGSRTPTGAVPYFYNPAVISPLAAGIAGGIGGAIGAAIAEGQQRRANRQNCLLIRGWRLVEPSNAEAAPALAMSEHARADYLNQQIGAAEVKGKITERTRFTAPDDPALHVDAPAAGAGTLWLGAKADPAAPFALQPGEAAIVVAFRRPTNVGSQGRSAAIELIRYDMAKRDLVYRPRDWKKTGDKTSYALDIHSGDKTAPYEVHILRVTPGDYVLDTEAPGGGPLEANCFGAPTFHIEAGEVGYLGDFIPVAGVKLTSGTRFSSLVYAGPSDNARLTLTTHQPALAALAKPVTWRNRATYACAAVVMTRQDLPGADSLPDQPAAATSAGL